MLWNAKIKPEGFCAVRPTENPFANCEVDNTQWPAPGLNDTRLS
jgi:hypothetical protein